MPNLDDLKAKIENNLALSVDERGILIASIEFVQLSKKQKELNQKFLHHLDRRNEVDLKEYISSRNLWNENFAKTEKILFDLT